MRKIKSARIITLSFVLLLINSFASLAQSNEDKRKLAGEFFGKGEAAFKDKNYSEAIENFTVAIGLDPTEAYFYMRRGDAKLISRDNQGAFTDYSRVIQLCSDAEAAEKARKAKGGRGISNAVLSCTLPTAYLNRGIAKDRLGDKSAACEDFRTSCRSGIKDACKNSETTCSNQISLGRRVSASPKLTIGTYIANVEQATTATNDRDGFTVTDNLKMRIEINSIDEDGNVKARIVLNNEKGSVAGSIDSEGKLKLEGFLTQTNSASESEINLTATVKNNTLTKGQYLKTNKYVKSKGQFNIAVLEKEE